MAELAKIGRVVEREAGEAHLENLLVLDAGTGQNALSQAKQFGEAVPLSGLILTKLDGTAKGGAVVGISHESGLPAKLIGVGEGIEDLRPFVPEAFIAALFEE
jgi:fused signal recognition particle receptor